MKKLVAVLLFLTAVTLYAGLMIGPVYLSVFGPWTELHTQVFVHIRLIRLITAFLVGGTLAMAGAVFQGMLHNPLADPYVLGVSSGAAFGACLSMVVFSSLFLGLWGAVGFTFIGALAATALLLAFIRILKSFSVIHFVLTGVMINAFFSSCTLIMIFLSQEKLRGVMVWLMGDLGHSSWAVLGGGWILAVFSIIYFMKHSETLNAMALGDEFALSLGIPVQRIRGICIGLASVLTGLAVACAGVIGFVGLLVPHTLRFLMKENFKTLIPLSFLAGGWFLMAADLIARTLFGHTELPVGIITSLCGAPFFMVVLLRYQKRLGT